MSEIATTDSKPAKRGRKPGYVRDKPPKPESLKKHIQLVMYANELPAIDTKDPIQVEQRCNDYLQYCTDNNLHPVIMGLGIFIGVHRETVRRWITDDYSHMPQCGIVKKYVSFIDALHMSRLASGDGDTISGIYISKATLGYREQQDINISVHNPAGDVLEHDEIVQRYLPEGES